VVKEFSIFVVLKNKNKSLADPYQGDQIGRIFAQRAIAYLDSFSKSTDVAQFLATFSTSEVMYICINFDKIMCWATFWACFPQTHLVTLIHSNVKSGYH
jgi:hypothetical protein